MDMSDQYVEFINGLKSGDVLFSWSKALGTNYIGLFAYYVSSPFSALTLLIPNRYMHYGVLVVTALKLGCIGLTSRLYFAKCWDVRGAAALLFSLSCSMMSYCLAYSMCIMWLDGLIWLPIILMGEEKLLAGEKPLLFRLSLFICFLSTYYISYMIVLFAVLYFLVRCAEERRSGFLRLFSAFAGSGILAAGLAAFFLVPVFLSVFEGRISNTLLGYSGTFNFSFRDLIEKLLFGGYDSITNTGTPNVYCGLAVLWFAVVFFAGSRISLRSRICWGLLLVLLALSFWLAPLDRIWHAFQHPNWFPFRYSFLFSFTLICTAARAFRVSGAGEKRLVVLFLLVFSIADLGWNGVKILQGLDDQFGYQKESVYREFQIQKAYLLEPALEDDGFFRVRSSASADRSKNDAIGFGYSGLTHYSSSYLSTLNDWTHRIGLGQGWIWSSDYGSTPVTDLFLDIRYAVDTDVPGPYYEMLREEPLGALYRTSVSGSLGYFVDTEELDYIETDDPFTVQNSLFSLLTETGDVFQPIETSVLFDSGETLFDIISNGEPLYCYLPMQSGTASLYVNDRYICDLFRGETDCIHYLGTCPAGEHVIVTVTGSVSAFSFRYLDTDVFDDGSRSLRSIELQKVTGGGTVRASVECPADGMVLTSVPDGGGWHVRADGERTETVTALGAFLAIPVSAGDHELVMRYCPPGMAAGMCISVLSAAVWLALEMIGRYKKNKHTEFICKKD